MRYWDDTADRWTGHVADPPKDKTKEESPEAENLVLLIASIKREIDAEA